MADEYVVTLARRNPNRPLVPAVLVEFGVPVGESRALAAAVSNLGGMLQQLVTPEAVAKFMRNSAALAQVKQILKGV